jgi:RHS repeat-associated protein
LFYASTLLQTFTREAAPFLLGGLSSADRVERSTAQLVHDYTYSSCCTSYYYDLTGVVSAADPARSCNPISGSGAPSWEANCVSDSWAPSSSASSNHDSDWQDYYHSEFRGFATVYIVNPAGNLTVDQYMSTEGWGTPESDGSNYTGGQLYQQDVYQGTSQAASTLLRETDTNYVGIWGYASLNGCDTSLTTIYTPCEVAPLNTYTYDYEGTSSASPAPWTEEAYTYDDLNATSGYTGSGYHNLTQEVDSSSNAQTITKKWAYNSPDNQTVGGLVYYDVNKVTHSEVDDASGHVWLCQDTTYDEGRPSGIPTPAAGLPTTVTNYSNCSNQSGTALPNYTAYDKYGNVVATVDALGATNVGFYTSAGCTLGTTPIDLTSAWTSGSYTTCTTYDTETASLPVALSNAWSQTTDLGYDYTSSLLLNASTDPNGAPSSYGVSYDSSGNETILGSEPGETGAYTTRQSESSSCPTSNTRPCYEIDSNSLLYSSAISRTFYDSQGRAVETRTPGPTPGDDTVVMTVYNDQTNSVWTSEPFEAADGSGWIDPNGATDINGHIPAGSTIFYDALGRPIATQDPNYSSTQEPGISCSTILSGTFTSCINYGLGTAMGDTTIYAYVQAIDADDHMAATFSDTYGNTRYSQEYSGTASLNPANWPDNLVQQKALVYNALGEPTSINVTDEQAQSEQSTFGVTTSVTYNDLGQVLTVNDPDQGTMTYTYDPDGNVLSTVQTSGSSSRTTGYNYDILGRLGCEQTAVPTINATGACSAGNPLIQNTFDTSFLGTQWTNDFPIGHLTKSVATTYFPDSTSATVTQEFQTNARGQATTEQEQINVPSGWNVTTALPAYQVMQAYNDADQPTTTTTSAGSLGYTFTQVYDTTTGTLTGLSNNSSNTADLATLAYNEYAELSQINFQTSTGASGLATEQFGYDGDQRPASITATWASNSGQSGSFFNQTRNYDNAGNVISLTTTQAQIQGQSASGGSQTENYCYDEQNRLIWAGNSGTQPADGDCGSGTLSNTLSGAGYTAGYVYTHLDQLWQGPVQGSNQAEQYLYCDSSHPHQLTGIYPLGTTCVNRSSATPVYSVSYDPWGNVSSRTSNSVTATLSYDAENQMVQWSNGSTEQQQYVYDSSGERVLARTTSGSATSMTVYALGLQEFQYNGNGTNVGGTSNTYYYTLGGMLIGKFDGTNTTFFINDGLGSIVSSFSNTTGNAAVQGNQTYEPYGKSQYQQGNMGTNKGYTGQDNDTLTGLDYYNARYYDPVAGIFLSPDSVQGNESGMDPYAYVQGNPETATDPTGQADDPEPGGGPAVGDAPSEGSGGGGGGGLNTDAINAIIMVAVWFRTQSQFAQNGTNCALHGNCTGPAPAGDPGFHEGTAPAPAPAPVGDPGFHEGTTPAGDPGFHEGKAPANPSTGTVADPPVVSWVDWVVGKDLSSPCSFTSNTQVETPAGEQSIGTLKVGEQVMAYNPQTHKMEAEPILHVWIHQDSDLINLTITSKTSAHNSKSTTNQSEVVHTTSEHPFLTDHGFVPASQLKVGMKVQQADGSFGTITGWTQVQGTQTMYNLEVNQDHTFAVGEGEWVVHNQCDRAALKRALGPSTFTSQAHHIVPCELANGATPGDDPVNDFLQAAIRGGWLINGANNGIYLPVDDLEGIARGLPTHFGNGGHPNTVQIRRTLDAESYDDRNNLAKVQIEF